MELGVLALMCERWPFSGIDIPWRLADKVWDVRVDSIAINVDSRGGSSGSPRIVELLLRAIRGPGDLIRVFCTLASPEYIYSPAGRRCMLTDDKNVVGSKDETELATEGCSSRDAQFFG